LEKRIIFFPLLLFDIDLKIQGEKQLSLLYGRYFSIPKTIQAVSELLRKLTSLPLVYLFGKLSGYSLYL